MRAKSINRTCLLALATALLLSVVDRALAAVTFDWATVGDVGNSADTLVMSKGPAADNTTGYGAVDYEFQIATTHVTNSQYTEFLNAVDPNGDVGQLAVDPPFPQPKVRNGIYNENMMMSTIGTTGVAYTGGINYSSAGAVGSKYSVKSGQENYPATWINWDSGARFVNWLHNEQGTGDMENGVYDMSIGTQTAPPRQDGATVFIPSEDEFYKAAYYDPTKNGLGGYWQYGVQSDSPPTSEGPSGGATSANFATAAGSSGSTGDIYWQNNSTFDDSLDHLTDVGAYDSATSYYGLHDVDGLIFQYTEGIRDSQFGDFPAYRGGSWHSSSEFNGAALRAHYSFRGATAYAWFGLRIASVVTGPTLAADFDEDGDVDEFDLSTWDTSYGTNGGGDTNNDGVSDGLDFLTWQREYTGDLSTAQLATTSVPEPASGTLLCTLLALSARVRVRKNVSFS